MNPPRGTQPQHTRPAVSAALGLAFAASMLISGCASPTERIDRTAAESGFTRHNVSGNRFDHLVMTRNLDGLAAGGRLHVYIEGDGSAWIANRWIAQDPTPLHPVALDLMRIDPGPVLYLGRPCYFQLQRNCIPALWAADRYSETVVEAMAEALNAFLDTADLTGSIALIGYSGGGTLAMLLASRIAAVDALITVASNLDVDRWTKYHGYSALTGSLNPATQAPLPERIKQVHLLGGMDKNVPPKIVEDALDRQLHATLLRYPDYSHDCCWPEVWPEVLGKLSRGDD